MLWFYVSALAVLVGAELNAEIEHASPYGKDPGERVPGEKEKIGAVAERAWEEGEAAGTLKPAIATANCDVDDDLLRRRAARAPRASDWIVSGLVLAKPPARLREAARAVRPGPRLSRPGSARHVHA